jgi:hypothetical protein
MAKKTKPEMRVMVYGIGGQHPEEFMGCARDPQTALNLLKLLKLTGSHSCSLHGTVSVPSGDKEFSGECGIGYAENYFVVAAQKRPRVYV